MPLPENANIETALSKIELSPTEPAPGVMAIQLPLLAAVDETLTISQEKLWLLYGADTEISLGRLLERIGRELALGQHSQAAEFSLFALAFADMIPVGKESRTARLNKVLSYISDADVNLYFLFGSKMPEYFHYEIPPFRYGPLRIDKIRYNCAKVQSDFYERYKDGLRKVWAIEREPKSTRVLDLARLRNAAFPGRFSPLNGSWREGAWPSLVDGYFSIQNQILFETFWTDVVSSQDVLLSMGAPFSDTAALRSILSNLQVAIFMNVGAAKFGFVAPAGNGPLAMDLANAHERIPAAVRELKEKYNFEQFDNSPLHGSIKLFASFVARARRHQIKERADEALLHFVIALELIFGERANIQKSVSERVALITFREAGCSFEERRSRMDKIYDLRSNYVHAGKIFGDDTVVEELYQICQQVFRCLMRLQVAKEEASDKGADVLQRWLAIVDYLAKGIAAGKDLTHADFEQAFIAQAGDPS